VQPFGANVQTAGDDAAYGAWINGYPDVTNAAHRVSITDTTFNVGEANSYSLAFDGLNSSQVTAAGNTFGVTNGGAGGAGAIRILDSNDALTDGQGNYTGINGNTFDSASGANGQLVNNTDYYGGSDKTGITVSLGTNAYQDGQFAVIDASDDTSGGQTLTGGAGQDIITGSAFDDTINGGGGSDRINGGAGIDTVDGFSANAQLSFNGTHWVVTDGGSTTTLTSVEKVVIGMKTYDLVDHAGAGTGGFQTIQAAVSGAASGEVILVAGGTYNENVTVNESNLTLENETGQAVKIVGTGGFAGAIDVAQGVTGTTIESSDNAATFVLQGAPAGETAALHLVGGNTNTTISWITTTAAPTGVAGHNAALTGGGLTNVTFENNVFSGSAPDGQLVYVNGLESVGAQDSNVNFLNNTFSGSAPLLLGVEAKSGDITGNTFSGSGGVGIGLAEGGTISDTAANLSANINALEAGAGDPNLKSITRTDPANPLSISASQVTSDSAALALFTRGSGSNILAITTAGSANLSGVSAFPTIDLMVGGDAVTLGDTTLSGGAVTINDEGSGNSSVNAVGDTSASTGKTLT